MAFADLCMHTVYPDCQGWTCTDRPHWLPWIGSWTYKTLAHRSPRMERSLENVSQGLTCTPNTQDLCADSGKWCRFWFSASLGWSRDCILTVLRWHPGSWITLEKQEYRSIQGLASMSNSHIQLHSKLLEVQKGQYLWSQDLFVHWTCLLSSKSNLPVQPVVIDSDHEPAFYPVSS